MSAMTVTFRRTVDHAKGLVTNALSIAAFLSAAAAMLAFNLEQAEGGGMGMSSLWAISVAPFFPAFCAFLGMGVWSDECRTGRVDMMLSAAVRERDLTLGKFLGVWGISIFVLTVSLFASLALASYYAPAALASADGMGFFASWSVLALQGVLWCAIAVMASAMCESSAVAACVALMLTVALPRGGWLAYRYLRPSGQTAIGEFPLDAQVMDFSVGSVSAGVIVGYVVLAAAMVFIASKRIAARRYASRGSRTGRLSMQVTMALSVVAAVSVLALVARFDCRFELPIRTCQSISPRLGQMLSELSGELTLTVFMSRSDARFRTVDQFLRGVRREAEAGGGVRATLRFVDPRWDLGESERLVRQGVKADTVFVEYGRRTAMLPVDGEFGENAMVSGLRSVAMPLKRRNICWVSGHGEGRFDAYDTWGMSDIARQLNRSGYHNQSLDLSGCSSVPADCAFLVIAGAKEDFSRVELGRVEAYLKNGGRMLVLLARPGQGGVASLLPAWGIRPVTEVPLGVRTLSGSDVIASDFADHAITAALQGSRIVLEKPQAFASSAVTETADGVDKIDYLPIARAGSSTVVAAVERGAGVGSDLAFRPTRIVVIGDSTFVMNGQLSLRASANREFFLNVADYLSGVEVLGGGETSVFTTGMDRRTRLDHTLASVVAFPLAVFLVLWAVAWRRRRRG